MTMGPEPMIMTFLMSLRFGIGSSPVYDKPWTKVAGCHAGSAGLDHIRHALSNAMWHPGSADGQDVGSITWSSSARLVGLSGTELSDSDGWWAIEKKCTPEKPPVGMQSCLRALSPACTVRRGRTVIATGSSRAYVSSGGPLGSFGSGGQMPDQECRCDHLRYGRWCIRVIRVRKPYDCGLRRRCPGRDLADRRQGDYRAQHNKRFDCQRFHCTPQSLVDSFCVR